jgi:hypothetical protein
MKFLIMVLPIRLPVPPEQGAEPYGAAREWIGERLGDGRMDCAYVFADGGGLAIGNAETHEQVFDELMSYSLCPFFRREVKPLCDLEHTFGTIVKTFSRAAG